MIIFSIITTLSVVGLALLIMYINRGIHNSFRGVDARISYLIDSRKELYQKYGELQTQFEELSKKHHSLPCSKNEHREEVLNKLKYSILDGIPNDLIARPRVAIIENGDTGSFFKALLNELVPKKFATTAEFVRLVKKEGASVEKLRKAATKLPMEALIPMLENMTRDQEYEAAGVIKTEIESRKVS